VGIKQLAAGTRLLMPVWVEGGLFSAGDAHFAQGDCETCGTAIEMNATLRVRFDLRESVARERGIRDLQFERDDYLVPPEYQAPRRFFATTGISVRKDGRNESEDVTVAARNALLDMIDHLVAEYAAAGLRALQRGGGPQGERGRGRPELRGLGVPAARHLRRVARRPPVAAAIRSPTRSGPRARSAGGRGEGGRPRGGARAAGGGAYSIRCRRSASATAAVRSEAPSLRKIRSR